MGQWIIEKQNHQQVLTHLCAEAHRDDTGAILTQDLGGGYVRCPRCGEKFLPEMDIASPRLVMRLALETEDDSTTLHSNITQGHFS